MFLHFSKKFGTTQQIFGTSTVARYLPIIGQENEMTKIFTVATPGRICLEVKSMKRPTSGSLTIYEVASASITFSSSLVGNFKEALWKRIFNAGRYQITIRNVAGGDIHNIILDEYCRGLISFCVCVSNKI
jgi:hypothetical protein